MAGMAAKATAASVSGARNVRATKKTIPRERKTTDDIRRIDVPGDAPQKPIDIIWDRRDALITILEPVLELIDLGGDQPRAPGGEGQMVIERVPGQIQIGDGFGQDDRNEQTE